MTSLSLVALLTFMPFVTLTGLAIRMIVAPPWDMVFSWVHVLFLGVQKNSPQFHTAVLKLNIGL
jgi:hypothetical protein